MVCLKTSYERSAHGHGTQPPARDPRLCHVHMVLTHLTALVPSSPPRHLHTAPGGRLEQEAGGESAESQAGGRLWGAPEQGGRVGPVWPLRGPTWGPSSHHSHTSRDDRGSTRGSPARVPRHCSRFANTELAFLGGARSRQRSHAHNILGKRRNVSPDLTAPAGTLLVSDGRLGR